MFVGIRKVRGGFELTIEYDSGSCRYKNWIVEEKEFKLENQAKYETIFCLGNGYMGSRCTLEESYPNERPGFYVAGIFDQFPGEVTEMPNLPDWIKTEIFINNNKVDLTKDKIYQYSRRLNLKDGLLIREFLWEDKEGHKVKFYFERFISMFNLHSALSKIELEAVNFSGEIKIRYGYNARTSNSGTQHLKEGMKRLVDDNLVYEPETQQSTLKLCFALSHEISSQRENIKTEESVLSERRKLKRIIKFDLLQNKKVSICKYFSVYSQRDKDLENIDELQDTALSNLKNNKKRGYEDCKLKHIKKWRSIWDEMDIKISGNNFDQLAIRFALFHMIQMTPAHDNRISIAAKGLSGAGYKGHVFWDTEIFMLPFFIYNYPQIAKTLLKYRYNTLKGARKKAKINGYQGAMYAWESARSGQETTPEYGGIDIETGEEIEILSGKLQHHITADVQYMVAEYYRLTKDFNFMKDYGFEIFFESSRFWASRLEYNKKKNRYEINNIMGPDEYKKEVNNNAFTNHMVHWQFEKALEYVANLKEDYTKYFGFLKNKIGLNEKEIIDWQDKSNKLYIPKINKDNIIPQHEGFFDLKEIDLKKYKNSPIDAIFNDLSWEQINKTKVCKQADVVMLVFLLRNKFTEDVIKSNFAYYEPITLHDSSLSPGIHALVASYIGEVNKAYNLFNRASKIDLGENMKSSDKGLHAASLGILWQAIVFGFAGINYRGDKVYIEPNLPDRWKKVSFNIVLRNNKYKIEITKDKISIEVLKLNDQISFINNDREYGITEKIIINY